MDQSDELTQDVAALSAAVDTYKAKEQATIDGLNDTITSLKAQLATGTPGLTAAEGVALGDQIKAVMAKITDPAPVAGSGDTGSTGAVDGAAAGAAGAVDGAATAGTAGTDSATQG
jgi:hypothetical protein